MRGRAVTREGQAARARSYALWDAEMMKPQHDIEVAHAGDRAGSDWGGRGMIAPTTSAP